MALVEDALERLGGRALGRDACDGLRRVIFVAGLIADAGRLLADGAQFRFGLGALDLHTDALGLLGRVEHGVFRDLHHRRGGRLAVAQALGG